MSRNPDRTTAERRILTEGEIPEEYGRELCGLADVARDPLSEPLATLGAVLVLATFAYQALVVALTRHPVLGALVVAVAAGAYLIAKRLWALQHRHMVRELARAGELHRLED